MIRHLSSSKKLCALFVVLFVLTTVTPQKNRAHACAACIAEATASAIFNIALTAALAVIVRELIREEFKDHREWLRNEHFKNFILPALMKSTEQISAVAMQQMLIVGMFFDGVEQMETQRLFAELTARAHREHDPSEGICTFGSGMRSLAASERNVQLTTMAMAQRAITRHMMEYNSNSTEGHKEDIEGRTEQWIAQFCDKNDNNGGLGGVCGAAPQARKDKDIDFARTVMGPMTLNVDLSNGADTDDEKDIMAMMSNLYGSNMLDSVTASRMRENEASRQLYLDMRSLAAKRGVAEQAMNAIIAMKSSGSVVTTNKYLIEIMKNLGISSDTDVKKIIGDNPSYYAQMEILTKKLLQQPQFIVDLYDKPANVQRKGVVLEALSLIQRRDLFKSALRNEAIASLLLEMELIKAQEAVQDEANRMTEIKE